MRCRSRSRPLAACAGGHKPPMACPAFWSTSLDGTNVFTPKGMDQVCLEWKSRMGELAQTCYNNGSREADDLRLPDTERNGLPMPLYRSITPPHERFWAKVKKSDGCWLWTGAKNGRGYGNFRCRHGYPSVLAHRFAYELANGPIPAGLWVLHHCDNPSCVRPTHLFLGDAKANMEDAKSKGRPIGRRHNHLGARGESCYAAKLTRAEVSEIRTLYGPRRPWRGPGSHSIARHRIQMRELAARFGVSESTVGHIIRGDTWQPISEGDEDPGLCRAS